jgi:hypothetical protein
MAAWAKLVPVRKRLLGILSTSLPTIWSLLYKFVYQTRSWIVPRKFYMLCAAKAVGVTLYGLLSVQGIPLLYAEHDREQKINWNPGLSEFCIRLNTCWCLSNVIVDEPPPLVIKIRWSVLFILIVDGIAHRKSNWTRGYGRFSLATTAHWQRR